MLAGGGADFIDLNDSPKRFLEFYAQEFFRVCDYCGDYSKGVTSIKAAIQAKQVLTLKNPKEAGI